jgi:LuxR family transcriptional regulator, maltose regulon positive regulatory protein
VALAPPRLIAGVILFAVLGDAVARKVTIVSAPAGRGKTSLLRAWADRPGQLCRLAVVQVRRDQQDAQVFWLALLDAVRLVRGAPGGAAAPAATPGFTAAAMAGTVLAVLAGAGGDVMLVIEDLHELSSPGALGQLTRVADEPARRRARAADDAP